MRILSISVLAFGILIAGCEQEINVINAPPQTHQHSAIYENDTRVEAWTCNQESRCSMLQFATAAMIPSDVLMFSESLGSSLILRTSTASEAHKLCAGERFGDQPAAARCSGVLIDDDLLLTAAHCIPSLAECQRHFWVFRYLYTTDGQIEFFEDDVFACKSIPWMLRDTSPELGGLDLAVVQLDRSATPMFQPLEISQNSWAPAPGEDLLTAGFSLGTPLKLATGQVLAPSDGQTPPQQFAAAIDVFVGQSGSGILDVSGNVVGIISSGAPDLVWDDERLCYHTAVYDVSGEPFYEVASVSRRGVEGLCAANWPSERLCGTRTTCGDGLCNGTETPDICSQDCEVPRCGDGLCSLGELSTCIGDCGRHLFVPGEWTCPAEVFAASDGCDCNCGGYDPDCATENARIFRCFEGQTCSAEGYCEFSIEAPAAWRCDPENYANTDGCHCECGAYDPDCLVSPYPVVNCSLQKVCNVEARCATQENQTDPEVRIPFGWLCDETFYLDGSGCDCRCGVYDPDCENWTLPIYHCEDGEICNNKGKCERGIASYLQNIPDNWHCSLASYAGLDGCDCMCGAPDPDCNDPAQTLWGCSLGEICGEEGICIADIELEMIPPEWQCSSDYYAAGDGCDCACGAYDPDCDDAGAQRWGCLDGETCSEQGWCAQMTVVAAVPLDSVINSPQNCQNISTRNATQRLSGLHFMFLAMSLTLLLVRLRKRIITYDYG